ncbi:MAG: hypothetical protein HS100_12960 [Anaerolineales bacterium]|jgi:hypothetical protein|nr:hypothetical protein [Anaerolineales bacterium]
MVVLLMVGTVALMVGSAVLMLGSIVRLLLMRMIVGMIRSYMLTGSTPPVRPGLVANIKRRGALRRLGDLYLMDARLSLDRLFHPSRNLHFVLWVEHLRALGSQCIEWFTWLALLCRSHGNACRAKNERQRDQN